jgi:preprotein translocase subunit SecY
MQLAKAFIPHIEQLNKEGESGRRKISQYTRILTLLLCILQSVGLVSVFVTQGVFLSPDLISKAVAVTSIVAGSMFLLWLGERNNDYGIGNGISMLIFISIVAVLPGTIGQSIEQAREGEINTLAIIFMLTVLGMLSLVIVFVEKAQRKIAINSPSSSSGGANMSRGRSLSYLPLKINIAGVITAIFASRLLLLPYSFSHWFIDSEGIFGNVMSYISRSMSPNQPLYLIIFVVAVIFFCFLYTSIVFNSREIADNLRRNGSLILGIRPGKPTADYIDSVVARLTLAGSIYIAAVSIFPQLIASVINVPFVFAGTSVLIVIVVSMDFWGQVQSHLFSMKYSSLMKKVKLK